MPKETGNIEGIKFFKQQDIFCKDGCGLGFPDIEIGILQLADKIRDAFGQPLFINSSVRCPHHNTMIGGARFSQHLAIPGRLKGRALDIMPHNKYDIDVLKKICDMLNPSGGCGLHYPGWVHVDVRGTKARW